MQTVLLFILLLSMGLLAGCDVPASTSVDENDGEQKWSSGLCNGHAELCDRAYNEVSYLTAHNAMSSEEDGWAGFNQLIGVSQQLASGVRGLMLDTHYYEDVPYLCHGLCDLGKMPLLEGLTLIREYMEKNPGEVITIIFESYVSPEDTAEVFVQSGIDQYLYSHPAGLPWPTLRQMLEDEQRLVVFADDSAGSPGWYHPVWNYAFETHFHYEHANDMNCDLNRGTPGNDLFILNHFITNPWAQQRFAEIVNRNPFLLERVQTCAAAANHIANFVTVDFVSIGDTLSVVDSANGVQ